MIYCIEKSFFLIKPEIADSRDVLQKRISEELGVFGYEPTLTLRSQESTSTFYRMSPLIGVEAMHATIYEIPTSVRIKNYNNDEPQIIRGIVAGHNIDGSGLLKGGTRIAEGLVRRLLDILLPVT